MRTLTEQLSAYAAYHRDRRNIATHFVGIPMIVLSVFAFTARTTASVAGFSVSPALLVLVLGIAFYLRLDRRFGLAMLAVTAPAYLFGTWLAAGTFAQWLGGAVGLFVVGWAIQFVGHYFEGKKPAFVDDLVGLLVGPLFVVAEVAFALGLRSEVHGAIVAKVGPTHGGRKAAPPAESASVLQNAPPLQNVKA
jgi:uncharacterized membrane protein YGL010W